MAKKDTRAPLGRFNDGPTAPATKGSAPPAAVRKGADKPARRPPRRARAGQTAPAESQPAPSLGLPPRVTTGKTAAIWLDDEDRAILRKASILALKQGLKPSDSLILRAALRMMPLGPQLMERMQELIGRGLRGDNLGHQWAFPAASLRTRPCSRCP
jgi:hypothetical protein